MKTQGIAASLARKYLDPRLLAKLSGLKFRARGIVEGTLSGLHKSPYYGFNVEFAEYRQYMPGDELKTIDWKVYARTDKYFVKKYEDSTNLKTYILLDMSGSMRFGAKLDYGRRLAANLAYLMLKQGDLVGLLAFSDRIDQYIPPRGGMIHLRNILATLDREYSGKKTDISSVLSFFASRLKHRGLIILISDLLDGEERVMKSLANFVRRRQEVVVYNVLSRSELDLDFEGLVRFVDLEEDASLECVPSAFREKYKVLFDDFLKKYRHKCIENGIDYFLSTCDESIEDSILKLLLRRRRA